jgi:hypothetical protein
MKKFNDWLAEKITIIFSTMWCFYVFVIYGLTPLVWPQYMDKILYWSNFIQLIALPALAVGGVVLARRQEKKNQTIYEAQEKRVQEDHENLCDELAEIKEMYRELNELVKEKRRK